jgi:hypothetical protein
MKNKNLCLKILLSVTPEQKDEIGAAARRAGMTTSEYIRSRILAHRASFEVGNNGFIHETKDGRLFSTDQDCHIEGPIWERAILIHRANGYHSDCVICKQKDEQWKAEVNAAEAEAADYAETVNSVRPGGM